MYFFIKKMYASSSKSMRWVYLGLIAESYCIEMSNLIIHHIKNIFSEYTMVVIRIHIWNLDISNAGNIWKIKGFFLVSWHRRCWECIFIVKKLFRCICCLSIIIPILREIHNDVKTINSRTVQFIKTEGMWNGVL